MRMISIQFIHAVLNVLHVFKENGLNSCNSQEQYINTVKEKEKKIFKKKKSDM